MWTRSTKLAVCFAIASSAAVRAFAGCVGEDTVVTPSTDAGSTEAGTHAPDTGPLCGPPPARPDSGVPCGAGSCNAPATTCCGVDAGGNAAPGCVDRASGESQCLASVGKIQCLDKGDCAVGSPHCCLAGVDRRAACSWIAAASYCSTSPCGDDVELCSAEAPACGSGRSCEAVQIQQETFFRTVGACR